MIRETVIVEVESGPRGPKGDPNELSIGVVTTTESGGEASAELHGEGGNQTLDLTLPRGEKGEPGDVSIEQLNATNERTSGVRKSVITIDGLAPIHITEDDNLTLWFDTNRRMLAGRGIPEAEIKIMVMPQGVDSMIITNDGYILTETRTGNQDENPKPSLPQTARLWDLEVVFGYGQSNDVGFNAVPLTLTLSSPRHLSHSSGIRSRLASMSQVGPAREVVNDDGSWQRFGETGLLAFANQVEALLRGAYDVPSSDRLPVFCLGACGESGAHIDQLVKGSANYTAMIAALTAWKAYADANGKTIGIRAVRWNQGESFGGDTIQQHVEKVVQMVEDMNDDFKVITGQAEDVHLYIAQMTNQSSSANAALAHLALDGAAAGLIHVSHPQYAFGRTYDGTHWNGPTQALAGCYTARAFFDQNFQGGWKAFRPTSITATVAGSNTLIVVAFPPARTPLWSDIDDLGQMDHDGFAVYDGPTRLDIDRPSPQAPKYSRNEARFLVVGNHSGKTLTIRYGLDYGGAGLSMKGAETGGNLTDSCADTVNIIGRARNLWNRCLIFQQDVIVP